MSFLQFCNKLFDKANERLQKLEEDISQYREMYEELDDERLMQYYKESSPGAKQLAIAAILRERRGDADSEDDS